MILFTTIANRIGITGDARHRVRRFLRPAVLGTLRRTEPLSRDWGFDRGMPVDRYYIERFLGRHAADVTGRVLEVKDSTYTDRFGSGVTSREVLDINPGNSHATVIADLAAADHVPGDQFDCFILTQTLQLIYDVRAAIAHAHRILRPGGVLLATVPSTSRLAEPDYWRFTPAACVRLFGDVFGVDNATVIGHGNVLTNVAFLEGMAWQELKPRELETDDEIFPLIVTVRAVKTARP